MAYSSIVTPIAPISSTTDENLPPVASTEFLPQISRWTTIGGLFLVTAITASIALAAVTKYRITVTSQGFVRPTGNLRLVQSAVEGRVLQILGKENQQVKKGDPIAVLDDSKILTTKDRLEIQVQQSQLQITQLDAQLRTIDLQIAAEKSRYQHSMASDLAKLRLSQRNYRDKQITSNADVREAQANLSAAQNEWRKAQAQLKSILADYQSARAVLKSAFTKQQRYQKVAKLGAISQDQFEEVKLAFQQQQQKVRSQQAAIEVQQQTIAQLQQNVRANRAKLESLNANLQPSNAEVAISNEQLAQSQANGTATIALLAREKESLVQKKLELDRQLQQDRRQLQQIAIELQQTTIRATLDGTIAKLNLRNSGQVVRWGEEIAQIVPSSNDLAIEVNVPPSEISKVKTGQLVKMQVSACPYPDYGTLEGVVSQISVDTFKPQSLAESSTVADRPASVYKVVVKPRSLMLGRAQQKCQVRLGMEGKTEIIAGEQTFLKFLLTKSGLALNR